MPESNKIPGYQRSDDIPERLGVVRLVGLETTSETIRDDRNARTIEAVCPAFEAGYAEIDISSPLEEVPTGVREIEERRRNQLYRHGIHPTQTIVRARLMDAREILSSRLTVRSEEVRSIFGGELRTIEDLGVNNWQYENVELLTVKDALSIPASARNSEWNLAAFRYRAIY